MSSLLALQLIARFLGGLAIIQGFEFIRLRKVTTATGVWRWRTLETEIGGSSEFLRAFFGFFLESRNFCWLNVLRVVLATNVCVQPTGAGVAGLLLLHILTMIRWRGSFNGGSDYMNSLLLLFTALGLFFTAKAGTVCLIYITLQTCRSYMAAGWVKLKNPRWRSGEALKDFLSSSQYQRNLFLETLTKTAIKARLISWLIIFFELSFTLSLLDLNLLKVYLILAICFHIANSYIFGLNRFLFAWLAAYPALIYCATLFKEL